MPYYRRQHCHQRERGARGDDRAAQRVFYTLDVRTGKTILPPRGIDGQPVGTLHQIDLKALATSSPSAAESDQGAVWEEAQHTANAPLTSMGHAWFPMGYNAQTGL